MTNRFDNFGLGFLTENEETMMGFVGYCVENGKALRSYSGTPYFFMPMGAAEFWVRTEKNEEGNLSVSGIDPHCGGKCIWELEATDINLGEDDQEPMKRCMVFKDYRDGSGMLPIEVITPDVLPGLMGGDRVTMQVIALPVEIGYYADEDALAETAPVDKAGNRWMVENGSLFPSGLMYNHAADRPEEEKDYSLDTHIQFTATVKQLFWGTFAMGDHMENTFIRCICETQFGDLEFEHTVDQVPEELRENMKVGAVVSGICTLQGDVALYEYENGIVKDAEHNLLALRYTFANGHAERLFSILAENAQLYTETYQKTFYGAQAIVERMRYVHENHKGKYIAHMAQITRVEDETLPYPVGTRCIVLADNEEDNYESIAFIECNEDGMIEKVHISTDGRYHFAIDKKPMRKSILDDLVLPDSVAEMIVIRAKFHGLIDREMTTEEVLSPTTEQSIMTDNARRMLEVLNDNPPPNREVALENIFGYLYAKAIEMEYNERAYSSSFTPHLTASYSPFDAFEGILCSTLSDELHKRLEEEMDLGKQFYLDCKNYALLKGVPDEAFNETLTQALVVVQRIGQLVAEHFGD